MHIPVLQKEIIQYLNPRPNENFIDATFGEGGHSAVLLDRNKPNGKVLGIEIDPDLYKKATAEISKSEFQTTDRLILVNDSYTNLEKIVEEHDFRPVNGILFDLGISSWHLEESRRGFSFKRDEPLDMRYNPTSCPLTAFEIVNYWSPEEIERVLKEFGEEQFARRIAERIGEKRKIKTIRTTLDLVEVIKESVPSWYKNKRIHFATKTFQALRIAVNNELENLKVGLLAATKVLDYKGKIAVISFHSLEDRIVKNFFKQKEQKNSLEIITKKPIGPSDEEIKSNPRSRSAKLRVAQKI
jgi:16S rRNA (cytosine1402-N4)-methyltransferase